MASGPKIRPQQYRLGWPLTATQLEHIDTMFETLFRAVRKLSGSATTATDTEPVGTTALGIAGSLWGDAETEPSAFADQGTVPTPGPQGPQGVAGPPGIPGQDGEDGGDTIIVLPAAAAAASSGNGILPYDPGSLTITDGHFLVMAGQLILSGSESMTIQGNGQLSIVS